MLHVAVTRTLNMTDNHPERIDTKLIKATENFNWDGITFPVDLKQMDRFEKQNPTISVNVLVMRRRKQPFLGRVKLTREGM